MSYVDPVTGHIWHNNVHLEIRRKYVSAEAAQAIIDIMEGKPYKMKSEDISDDKIKEIATYIIVGETEDVEYLTVVELTDFRLNFDNRSDVDIEEREKVWRRVNDMITKAIVSVEFED